MDKVVSISGSGDGPFVQAVCAGLTGVQVSEIRYLPSPLPKNVVVMLLWSRALEDEARAIGRPVDIQALVELWSEARLVVVRRDDSLLPLGMRDLESIPPTENPSGVAAALRRAIASGNSGPTLPKSDSEGMSFKPLARRSIARRVIPVIGLVCAVSTAAYYFFIAEQRAGDISRAEAPKSEAARRGAPATEPAKAEAEKKNSTITYRGGHSNVAQSQQATAAPDLQAPPAPSSRQERGDGQVQELFSIQVFGLLAAALLGIGYVSWRWARRSTRAGRTSDPLASPGAFSRSTTPSASGPILFISYSHRDKQEVEPIVLQIEKMGRRIWMDRTGITGQAGWAGQIVRAIRECHAVVLLASPNSYASDQVVRELYLAMNHKKPIVPIELAPAELPDELQYILAPFQRHRLEAGETSDVLGRALAAV
jgi:hypothetical protein